MVMQSFLQFVLQSDKGDGAPTFLLGAPPGTRFKKKMKKLELQKGETKDLGNELDIQRESFSLKFYFFF